MQKRTTKHNERRVAIEDAIAGIIAFIAFSVAIAIGVVIFNIPTNSIVTDNQAASSATLELSDEQIPGVLEDDMGELITDESIPTVDEVDGGQFEDMETGVSALEGEYDDLGTTIEIFDTSTPQTFAQATLNKCIIARNKYGAQCVSYARSFWFSYANRDVSTCGTGMAKGMMNCADVNAGDDFVVIWADDANTIQAGDWLVFNGGTYGHVGMALGPVVNGYVVLQGENQGGNSCGEGVGGSAVNRINKSVKDFIGGYRPTAYIVPEPEPEPEPTPEPAVDKCKTRTVEKGDTLGSIMKECTGSVKWGEAMNEYARHWFSAGYKYYTTVFDGWISSNGVGLFAGDTIEYRD